MTKYKMTAYLATMEGTESAFMPFMTIVSDQSELDLGDGTLGASSGYGDGDGDSSEMFYNDECIPMEYRNPAGNGDGDGKSYGFGAGSGDGSGHPYP